MNDSTKNLDDLMDRYLFGLLDGRTTDRVRRQIETDPEWQLAYEAAVERKRTLVGAVRNDGSEPASDETAEARRALRVAHLTNGRYRRERRIVRWSRNAIAAAALVMIAAWVYFGMIQPAQRTVQLLGQSELLAGSTASFRGFVRDLSGDGVSEAPLELTLYPEDGLRPVVLANWTTDESGSAGGAVEIPRWKDGQYTLVARTAGHRGSSLRVPITLRRQHKIYLSTDKPIYQPGQTLHMRCLVLQKPSLHPLDGGSAEFSVTDPSGNIIFRLPATLSEYGIASADLPLDELIINGRYTVAVTVDSDVSRQTVEIFHYKLPAFSVSLALNQPYYTPGERIAGAVELRYHFGQPVPGASVDVELRDPDPGGAGLLQAEAVTTNEQGLARFHIDLPKTVFGSLTASGDSHLRITARATDSAGQENAASRTLIIAAQDIRIAVAAENGLAQSGIENRLYIVTTYPDGRPAKTIVDVPTLGRSVRSTDSGVAVLETRRLPSPCQFSARDAAGMTGDAEVQLSEAQGEALILRTGAPVYEAGDTAAVEVIAPGARQVFLDVIQEGQTILTRTLRVKEGRATMALDLPVEVAGTLKLHAYRLGDWGEWIGRDLLLIVRAAKQLEVAVTTDRDVYRPGEDATLRFRVTDEHGEALPAALSLAGVDEAVYSVQQSLPGLQNTLLGVEEELLAPAIEACGGHATLVGQDLAYTEAVLAAAVAVPQRESRLERLAEEGIIDLRRIRELDRQRVLAVMKQYPGLRDGLSPKLLRELLGSPSGPHSLDRDNRYEAQVAYRQRKSEASDVAWTLTLVGMGVLLVVGMVAAIAGPGMFPVLYRIAKTSFIVIGVIMFLGFLLLPSLSTSRELGRRVVVASTLNGLAKAEALYDSVTPAAPDDTRPERQPSTYVRSYFPETLLWRPQVITDDRGSAELTIPLADSITTWRVSGSCVSQQGRLGGVESSIRVFQPFFVDIDAPHSLTAGDEVSIPLVLYNYTGEALRVSLRAESQGGLQILQEELPPTITQPGRASRTHVRVHAESSGDAVLTLHASAGGVADAIRREIRIVPPGLPKSFATNGVLSDGDQVVELMVPDDAEPDSVRVQLKLYPSTFSELMDGLEGIFRKPYGCFEQTTSITYPNVMALSYLNANDMQNPEVIAKATHFVHLGYQRLLSFEVKGGGFSLYGKAPASLPLTAYGLMEFSDMAKVHNVDPAVLDRTATWLIERQQPDGSWRGHLRLRGTGGVTGLATTAYITWALAEYDPSLTAVGDGASFIARHIGAADDSHTLAICVNALLAAGRSVEAEAGLRQLAQSVATPTRGQSAWTARGAPLAYSRGLGGTVETTSLVVLALSRSGKSTHLVPGALSWLADRRDPSGAWRTTHATVLALKAVLAGSNQPAKRDGPAQVVVTRDAEGEKVRLAALRIDPAGSDVVHAVELPDLRSPGSCRLRIAAINAEGLPYQLVVRYRSPSALAPLAVQPSRDRGLSIDVDYDRSGLVVGETVTVSTEIRNSGAAPAELPLADVGIPPGFSVSRDGLERLQDQGLIDRYTITPRSVILYLPTMQPGKRVKLSWQMAPRMPLRAVAKPSTVQPYYQPELIVAQAGKRFDVQ
jgi:A-macroglobulin complement component/alpha-2-macroglobulin family protein/MG2 domain-containing protein/A-macroglobulin receptor